MRSSPTDSVGGLARRQFDWLSSELPALHEAMPMSIRDRIPGDPLPTAPSHASFGPLSVGVRTEVATDPGRLDVSKLATDPNARYDRTLRFEVWYPTAAAGPATTYADVLMAESGVEKEPFEIAGRAIRDATPLRPASASERFPLVVVTHGYPGSRSIMTWLTESLASHGYVVVALDVTDSTHADMGPRAITLLHRPLDVLFAIRTAASWAERPDHPLRDVVDVERTALVGYSMGGYASLNAAGVGFRPEFVRWPDSVPADALASRQTGSASLAASIDPRVRAVATIAPWGAGVAFGADDLASLTLPTLFVVGDRDETAGYSPGVRDFFEWAVNAPRHLLTFREAGHSIGANPPPSEATTLERFGHYADPVWSSERVHDLARHFVRAFLDEQLKRVDATALFEIEPDAEAVHAGTWPGFPNAPLRGVRFESRDALPAAPSLPGDDAAASKRGEALAREQKTYRYNYTINPPLAMADEVPAAEQFPAGWMATNLRVLGELLENSVAAANVFDPMRRTKPELAAGDRDALSLAADARAFDVPPNVRTVPNTAWAMLAKLGAELEHVRLRGASSSYVELQALFQTIAAPEVTRTLFDDASLVRNYLAGGNPLILKKLDSLDGLDGFGAALASALGEGDSGRRALADGRLFVADYAALDGVPCGTYQGRPKFLPAPLVLLATRRDSSVVPVGIRLGAKASDAVVTPKDGASFLMGRTAAMTADANMSAVYYHHARTHMVVEPVVLATHRQLAPNHPLRVLLLPHFDGTLAINRTGQQTVFAEGGLVEVVGAAARPTFRSLAVSAVASLRRDDLDPRRSMSARGVLSNTALPGFSYRDDVLEIWDAIVDWVNDYLRLYYADDEAVRRDRELAAFAAELADENGGRIGHIVGSIASFESLAHFTSLVVFTASALHWALNGPLATWMTFAPNYPLASYAAPKAGATYAEWLAMLPPLDQAQRQLEAATGMGRTRWGRLGAYAAGTFVDPRVERFECAFRARLEAIERRIDARNATRRFAYTFLRPSQIPASINI